MSNHHRGPVGRAFLTASVVSVLALQVAGGDLPQTYQRQVAEAIRAKYERLLPNLELEQQRHFAVRLYRMTGEEEYLHPIVADLRRAAAELERDLAGRDDPTYVGQRSVQLLDDFNEKTRRGRLRKELFRKRREMLFALNVLANTKRVAEHRLSDARLDTFLDESRTYLLGIDFAETLLDEAVIRVFSPQAVNYVYYLHDLGVADLRLQFKIAFQKVFPDASDDRLSKDEFRDKVYGLTHFILAASDYYQRMVDSTRFPWILEYFAVHVDSILEEATSDIIAEVGICFLLAGNRQHPALLRCQNRIADSFDVDDEMILSPRGSSDAAGGEHRNVLAYMLLTWPDTLYPGPYFTGTK